MATETNPPLSKTVIVVNIVGAVIAALSAIIDLEWVKANSVLFTSLGVLLATLNALYPILLRLTTTTLLKVVLLALTLGLCASPAHARPIRQCDGTACKVTAEPTLNLSPAQARWFRAMPLPWIERNVIRALFGR